MHHKRKRSVRREVKRMDEKSYRMAERESMTHGTIVGMPRTDKWCFRPEPLPLGDVPCNGKRHGKKKERKAKEICLVNGTHEWYRETEVKIEIRKTGKPGCYSCEACWEIRRNIPWYVKEYCDIHLYEYNVEVTLHTSTCIHCWKEKVKKSERKLDKNVARWGFYRPCVLKKRPIQW